MIDIEEVKPLKGWILAEPLWDPEEGTILPSLYELPRYPVIAQVLAVGPLDEDVSPDQYVLIEDHGSEWDETYADFLEITFRYDGSVLVDPEIEPVIKENVETDRRRGQFHWITVEDRITGTGVRFTTDEVVDFQIVKRPSPRVYLSYVPTFVFHTWKEEGGPLYMFYIINQRNVLCTMDL